MMTHGKLVLAGWLVLLVALLGSGYETDHISCLRSNSVRTSQLGEERYALDAARVRFASARLEARSNPGQAALDRGAAARFILDASHIHIALLDCSGFYPTSAGAK